MYSNTLKTIWRWSPQAQSPAAPHSYESDSHKIITVLYTQPGPTLAALRVAKALAGFQQSQLQLVAIQTVPYRLPLEAPAVSTQFYSRAIRELVWQSGMLVSCGIYVGRDRERILKKILPSNSWIVLGASHHWWPFSEKRLAKRLRRLGFKVFLTSKGGRMVEKTTAIKITNEVLHV